ncbi:MAG: response regulator [Polyangiaceae bacterium]|nr:response regulator [Polyangiaceae bacterium]
MDLDRSARLAAILRERGYQAAQMQGVGAALAMCAIVPFTVIFVGQLPADHNAASMCRTLRQTSNSAIIALIETTETSHVTDLLDAGATDVLTFSTENPERLLLRVLVSERRVATQSHAEAMLRAIPDIVFRIHASGEFLSVHVSNVNDLYAAPRDVVGRKVAEVLPPPVATLCLNGMRRAVDKGEVEIFTYSLDVPGGPQDFEARLVPAGPDEVVAVVRNITDRTQAQTLGRANVTLAAEVAERRRAEQALRVSEAKWRSLVENCPDLIATVDVAGRVDFANRWAERRPAPEGATLFDLVPTSVHSTLRAVLDRVFSGGGAETLNAEDPTSQRVHSWELRLAPIADQGRVSRAVVIARDCAERRAVEAERARMQERLWTSQRRANLGLLAAGVAHDFNNQLTAILGGASVALLKLPEDGSARRAIETLVPAARRASELSQRLLAYSGTAKIEKRNLDLSTQVRDLILLLHAAIPNAIELNLNLAADLPPIAGDVPQIQQLIMNLVVNAAEAIGEQRGVIAVRTSQTVVDDTLPKLYRGEPVAPGYYVSLEVDDTGCGMDEATLDKVFEPHFSTKATGRGLGLAVVSDMVKNHGGALNVASQPGQGTKFRVLFPAASSELDVKKSDPAPPNTSSGTVLIVDDEHLLRRAATEIIEHFGYTALEAADGRAAVAVFERHAKEIDVVVLDMTMPGLSGEEVYTRIKALEPTAQIILSSGFSESEARRRFKGTDLAGFLQKPYTAEQLAQAIEKAMT